MPHDGPGQDEPGQDAPAQDAPVQDEPGHDDPAHAAPAQEGAGGRAAAIRARGLALAGGRGPVFTGVDLEIPAGTLFVLSGPAGSGRTSLLLTLAGRMIPSAGELAVTGLPLPRRRRAVQHAVTLGTVRGVNDLDGALTVEEHVLERLALISPWWRLLTPHVGDVPGVLAAVRQDGRDDLSPDRVVRDLTPYDRFRLGLALALAGRAREHQRVLAVDDVDALPDPAAVADAWRLLFALTRPPAGEDDGFTVIATCTAAGTLPDEIRIDERTEVHRMRRAARAGTPAGTRVEELSA